jgi:hypothetical protein
MALIVKLESTIQPPFFTFMDYLCHFASPILFVFPKKSFCVMTFCDYGYG